jgi:hypothetical protein
MIMRTFSFVALFLMIVGFSTAVWAHAMLDQANPAVGSLRLSNGNSIGLF